MDTEVIRSEAEMLRALKIITKRIKRVSNLPCLFVYEGTLLDRLTFFLLNQYTDMALTMLCSIRPCMDEKLIEEVKIFSNKHDIKLIGFQRSCDLDIFNNDVRRPACSNIKSYVNEFYNNKDGVLISSALIPPESSVNFLVNSRKNNMDLDLNAIWRSGNSKKNLLLYEGITIFQFVLCCHLFLEGELPQHQIPQCIVSCYNEQTLESLKTHLRHKDKYIKHLSHIRSGRGSSLYFEKRGQVL